MIVADLLEMNQLSYCKLIYFVFWLCLTEKVKSALNSKHKWDESVIDTLQSNPAIC